MKLKDDKRPDTLCKLCGLSSNKLADKSYAYAFAEIKTARKRQKIERLLAERGLPVTKLIRSEMRRLAGSSVVETHQKYGRPYKSSCQLALR